MKRRLAIIAVALSSACGPAFPPTGPTGNPVADVAGVWTYTATTLTVTAGSTPLGCVADLQSLVGAESHGTLSITQTGAALGATSRSDIDGRSCIYSGSVGESTMALGWNRVDRCDAGTTLTCSDGRAISFTLIADTINTTTSKDRTASGGQAQTYNVFVLVGGLPPTTLTINRKFTATKQ
jgi:hypothetical protein